MTMPWFDFKCKQCGREFEDETLTPKHGILCECGAIAEVVWKSFPLVNFNAWVPDYRLMDGKKEAIAAGMEE